MFQEYPQSIWPYIMVQYLYFRILKFPLNIYNWHQGYDESAEYHKWHLMIHYLRTKHAIIYVNTLDEYDRYCIIYAMYHMSDKSHMICDISNNTWCIWCMFQYVVLYVMIWYDIAWCCVGSCYLRISLMLYHISSDYITFVVYHSIMISLWIILRTWWIWHIMTYKYIIQTH